jgi:hypothetical protein
MYSVEFFSHANSVGYFLTVHRQKSIVSDREQIEK